MCVCVLAMSKRKAALYDLSLELKAVKCAEEKTKEAAACVNSKSIHAGYVNGVSRRRSRLICKSKESHVVASYNTLL